MAKTVEQLTAELNLLIENSKQNELIAKKLFDIETSVLSARSSEQLLQNLLDLIKKQFSLSGIYLLLASPPPISYLLNSNLQSNWHKTHTKQVSSDTLKQYHPENQPFLSNQLASYQHLVPAPLLAQAQSIALTPLTLEGKLFGSLLFCDNDPDRFTPQLGTFHLQQLAVKVSLCLSNVLIREQLDHMAHYDRLTKVANRRLMEICINEELIRQQRYGSHFSLLFIDCNKFKAINDTYGHDCGDKVLAYVASQLSELIRENDRCFRYAGDEFVIMLANQSFSEASLVAQRLCQFFTEHPMPYQNQQLNVTISCGVATSNGSQTMDELLKTADQQLYLSKGHQTQASE
ncbi:hypothetical protein tinsulaeT_12280 [Thalassotalea insulae]|uniref:diguanylate cyclase n=1 Tax=Thalassotalea insulae TaxID=2056778 RepID=A0ABQ6GPI0_9GAMM|nr:DUF484 family protein [Thalassotalea insulae]GLX77888.1 hypothetical protein tinsulaeT_12280 [Thalassotalea insulae]